MVLVQAPAPLLTCATVAAKKDYHTQRVLHVLRVCIYMCMWAYLNNPCHERLPYKMTWLSRAFWFLTETMAVWLETQLSSSFNNFHVTKFIQAGPHFFPFYGSSMTAGWSWMLMLDHGSSLLQLLWSSFWEEHGKPPWNPLEIFGASLYHFNPF